MKKTRSKTKHQKLLGAASSRDARALNNDRLFERMDPGAKHTTISLLGLAPVASARGVNRAWYAQLSVTHLHAERMRPEFKSQPYLFYTSPELRNPFRYYLDPAYVQFRMTFKSRRRELWWITEGMTAAVLDDWNVMDALHGITVDRKSLTDFKNILMTGLSDVFEKLKLDRMTAVPLFKHLCMVSFISMKESHVGLQGIFLTVGAMFGTLSKSNIDQFLTILGCVAWMSWSTEASVFVDVLDIGLKDVNLRLFVMFTYLSLSIGLVEPATRLTRSELESVFSSTKRIIEQLPPTKTTFGWTPHVAQTTVMWNYLRINTSKTSRREVLEKLGKAKLPRVVLLAIYDFEDEKDEEGFQTQYAIRCELASVPSVVANKREPGNLLMGTVRARFPALSRRCHLRALSDPDIKEVEDEKDIFTLEGRTDELLLPRDFDLDTFESGT